MDGNLLLHCEDALIDGRTILLQTKGSCLGALGPPEAVSILREFMARQCDSIEAMTRLEAIRKSLKPEVVVAR